MRLVIVMTVFFVAGSALAQNGLPTMTVKERLRILLWTEGITETNIPKAQPKKPFAEELERPLRKI